MDDSGYANVLTGTTRLGPVAFENPEQLRGNIAHEEAHHQYPMLSLVTDFADNVTVNCQSAGR
jgi:hypothetical protein